MDARSAKTNYSKDTETPQQKTERLLEEACDRLKTAVREHQTRNAFGAVCVELNMSAGNVTFLKVVPSQVLN